MSRYSKRHSTIGNVPILVKLKEIANKLPYLVNIHTNIKIDHYAKIKAAYMEKGKEGIETYIREVNTLHTQIILRLQKEQQNAGR